MGLRPTKTFTLVPFSDSHPPPTTTTTTTSRRLDHNLPRLLDLSGDSATITPPAGEPSQSSLTGGAVSQEGNPVRTLSPCLRGGCLKYEVSKSQKVLGLYPALLVIHSCVCLLMEHLLNCYYFASTGVGSRNTMKNKTSMSQPSWSF